MVNIAPATATPNREGYVLPMATDADAVPSLAHRHGAHDDAGHDGLEERRPHASQYHRREDDRLAGARAQRAQPQQRPPSAYRCRIRGGRAGRTGPTASPPPAPGKRVR